MEKSDVYQERYLRHQERKRALIERGEIVVGGLPTKYRGKEFWTILQGRRSIRKFNGKGVNEWQLRNITLAAEAAPSSCNRKAVSIKFVCNPAIEDLLVGARGWGKSVDVWCLLFADMSAYKSPAEKDFMPYLDAGHTAQNIQLACECMGLGACFVNPNCHDAEQFNALFNPQGLLFTGAVAIGNYEFKPRRPI